MKYLVVLALLALGGCVIEADKWARAEKLCAPNGGVQAAWPGGAVRCVNGATFTRRRQQMSDTKKSGVVLEQDEYGNFYITPECRYCGKPLRLTPDDARDLMHQLQEALGGYHECATCGCTCTGENHE